MTNRDQKITRLFESHSARLQRTLASRVNARPQTIEDACSHAWAQLVRVGDPDNPQVFGWLLITAEREAWLLAKRESAATSLDAIEGYDAPAPEGESAEAIVGEHELREKIATLPVRQQQVMILRAAGLSREQIGEALGWTLRTVDRQSARARKTLRDRR